MVEFRDRRTQRCLTSLMTAPPTAHRGRAVRHAPSLQGRRTMLRPGDRGGVHEGPELSFSQQMGTAKQCDKHVLTLPKRYATGYGRCMADRHYLLNICCLSLVR